MLARFSVSSSHTGQHHRSSVTMKVDACGPKSFWQAGRWRELFGSIFLVSLFFRFACTREIYFSRLSTCWQRDSGSGEGSIPDREKICYQLIGSVCSGHQALPSWRGWYLLQVRSSMPFLYVLLVTLRQGPVLSRQIPSCVCTSCRSTFHDGSLSSSRSCIRATRITC